MAHRPTDADRPRRVAFVDGTLRTEARLTRTDADGDGDVSMGLAGSWAAGAVLVDGAADPSGCLTTAAAGAGSRTRLTGPTSKRRVSSSSA